MPKPSDPSVFAQTISPGKPSAQQIRIEAAVLKTLTAEGATMERRFGLHLFNDQARIINPLENINLMNKKIMKERGWTHKTNNLMNAHLYTDGIDAGMAFYRAWKIDNNITITDCEGQSERVDGMHSLREAACDGITEGECLTLTKEIDRYLSRRHPELSRWIGKAYIDDYAVVCNPAEVFKLITNKVANSKKTSELKRQEFVATHGVDIGLAMYRYAKKLSSEQASSSKMPTSK